MMIFLANFFFIEILNMKLDTILFTVKIPFVKKFLKLCSTIKKINLYSTSREVRFLDKIEYSSTVLQRQVSNQLLSIDQTLGVGEEISHWCLTPVIEWKYLDTWMFCIVCVKNNGLEPAYSTTSGQSKCLVLRMQSRIINAILKYRV